MVQPNDLLAVLVDADNVPPAKIGAVLAEVARFGTASVKRVYGDWTKPNLSSWKPVASEHVIQPMQQFANTIGKNATDSALIIDAMDLLYMRRFRGFCIVSSDSDFTRLASRIREEGVIVYGFGERKTPEAFRNACDRFTYLDVLEVLDEAAAESTAAALTRVLPPKLRSDTKLISGLRISVTTASGEDGWANLATVGQLMRKQQPDFDSGDTQNFPTWFERRNSSSSRPDPPADCRYKTRRRTVTEPVATGTSARALQPVLIQADLLSSHAARKGNHHGARQRVSYARSSPLF